MFRKQHPKVGARPGTLHIAASSPKPRIRLLRYAPDFLHDEEIHDPRVLREQVGEDAVSWIDVQGLGDATVLQTIAETFDLHPLAMEDVVNVPQRPKAEMFGPQQLIICRAVVRPRLLEWKTEQISILLGPHYVITFQEQYGEVLDPVRHRIEYPNARLRSNGSDYLAYAILDTIIDAYYPVLESLGDQLGRLEDAVIENPSPARLRQLNQIKNRIVNLRRSIWPQREAVYTLLLGTNDLVSEPVRVFLRDTHDHCVQTTEVVEMYREMVTGLLNTYLSAVGHRTNEVMRVLTIMASVFIPLTFVAGIYGMNFENMPELRMRWAYPTVWCLMLGTVVAMLGYFRMKGWIGAGRADGTDPLRAGADLPDRSDVPPPADATARFALLDHDQRPAAGMPPPAVFPAVPAPPADMVGQRGY